MSPANLHAQGDVRPHVAELGEVVLFSTSPVLSRRVVEAWRSGAHRAAFAPGEPGRLVAYGRAPGSTMADVLDQIAQWPMAMSLGVRDETIPFRNVDSWHDFRLLLEATGAALRLVETLEWRSVDTDGDRRTTIEARLTQP